MKNLVYLFTLVCVSTGFSCKSSQEPTAACIDPAKINPNGMCTMQYDPVCGCDNKTYGNACTADNAGITSYTKGACPEAKLTVNEAL